MLGWGRVSGTGRHRAAAGWLPAAAAFPGRRILRPADGNRAASAAHVGRSQRSSATGSGAQRPGPPGHPSVHGSPGPTCAAEAASYRCGSISGTANRIGHAVLVSGAVSGGHMTPGTGVEWVFHVLGIRLIRVNADWVWISPLRELFTRCRHHSWRAVENHGSGAAGVAGRRERLQKPRSRGCGSSAACQWCSSGVAVASRRPGCSWRGRHASVRMLCGHSQATVPPHGIRSTVREWTVSG
ncbi:hypothetical protein C8K36_108229 [Rhodococcus sp. OK519]|nr:hypothetical protein C8K36_108229 [Rhodococcus sp. OK519]